MQESSVNLPTLDGCTELISCATGFKFEYVGVNVFGTLLALIRWQPGGVFSNSIKLMLERQKFTLYQQEMLLQRAKITLYQHAVRKSKITLYQQDMLLERQKSAL